MAVRLLNGCSWHKPKQLAYVAYHEWADRQHRKGVRQRKCSVCGLWLWPEEVGVEAS